MEFWSLIIISTHFNKWTWSPQNGPSTDGTTSLILSTCIFTWQPAKWLYLICKKETFQIFDTETSTNYCVIGKYCKCQITQLLYISTYGHEVLRICQARKSSVPFEFNLYSWHFARLSNNLQHFSCVGNWWCQNYVAGQPFPRGLCSCLMLKFPQQTYCPMFFMGNESVSLLSAPVRKTSISTIQQA